MATGIQLLDTNIERYVEALSGLTALTRSGAERVVKQVARQSGVATDQVGEAVNDLLERSRRNRETLTTLIATEVQRAVRTMGLASDEELNTLRKQVADLKREIASLSDASSRGSAADESGE